MIFLSLGVAFFLCFTVFLPENQRNIPQNAAPHEIVSLQEARQAYEKELTTSAQSLLDRWLGEGKSKVTVRADLDFAQNQQTQELLDVDNPALSKAQGDNVEYAYSKQTVTTSKTSGQVKRLSVAVLVDVQDMPSEEALGAHLRRLIEQAVGFDQARGDTLEMIETSLQPVSFFSNTVWAPSLLVFAIILLFVLFGVIMTKNGLVAEQIEPLPAVLPAFTNPELVRSATQTTNAVEGKIPPNALKKAQSLLQTKPDETLTLLRSWLCQSEGETSNES